VKFKLKLFIKGGKAVKKIGGVAGFFVVLGILFSVYAVAQADGNQGYLIGGPKEVEATKATGQQMPAAIFFDSEKCEKEVPVREPRVTKKAVEKTEVQAVEPGEGNKGYLVGEPKEIEGTPKVKRAARPASIFTCPCSKAKRVVPVVEGPKPIVREVERVVEKPVEKIVYRDRVVEKVVEKPVEKIVYRDRVVEKPVEKIVYRDREVEKAVEKTVYVDKVTKESLNLKDVYFNWDSSAFTSVALRTLKSNIEILKANPEVKVNLVGSASPEGKTGYNQRLSERRVNAVKNYLTSNGKIASNRIITEAVGAMQVPTQDEWPFARKVGFFVAQ